MRNQTVIVSDYPSSVLILSLILSLVFFTTGCASGRSNQFKDFSESGVGYANAVDILLKEAGLLAINTDSMVLLEAHKILSSDDRGKKIVEHNNLLKERIKILADLRRHTALLSLYFETLGMLAGDDSGPAMSKSTTAIVNNLKQLDSQILSSRIGESKVSDLMGPLTEIIVGQFQSSALEQELKAHALDIERELVLQEAVLKALGKGIASDLKAQINRAESREVVLPFVKEQTLSSEWEKRRREILLSSNSLASAEAASDAARKLRESFEALVQGKGQLTNLSLFLEDINRILMASETVKVTDSKPK